MSSILVTGATGRIGSRVVSLLLERGAHVRALCLPNDLKAVTLERQGATVIKGSLLDSKAVEAVSGVDTVFHLGAALTTRRATSRVIVESIASGTFNLIDAIYRRAGDAVRMVLVSSTSVYQWARRPFADTVPPDEAACPAPSTPYGAAKMSAELLVAAAVRRGILAAVVVRPCDTSNPAEILQAHSVFGRRWFVEGALRWYDEVGPGSVDTLPAAAYPQLNRATSRERLFTLHDRTGGEPMIQVNDASSVALALVELQDSATSGEVPIVNLVPTHVWPMRKFVEGVAALLKLDPKHAVIPIEVPSPAAGWVFGSNDVIIRSRPRDVLGNPAHPEGFAR